MGITEDEWEAWKRAEGLGKIDWLVSQMNQVNKRLDTIEEKSKKLMDSILKVIDE